MINRVVSFFAVGIFAVFMMCACTRQDLEDMTTQEGDPDNRVYELKGYSADEWIINAVPHDAAMLLRETGVTDIPDGWQSEYDWNQ